MIEHSRCRDRLVEISTVGASAELDSRRRFSAGLLKMVRYFWLVLLPYWASVSYSHDFGSTAWKELDAVIHWRSCWSVSCQAATSHRDEANIRSQTFCQKSPVLSGLKSTDDDLDSL